MIDRRRCLWVVEVLRSGKWQAEAARFTREDARISADAWHRGPFKTRIRRYVPEEKP